MPLKIKNFAIIIPAKNEENFIGDCLESIVRQTLQPVILIVVDDNSSDNTFDLVSNYAQRFDWIKVIRSESNKINKEQGGAVIKAFNTGLEYLISVELDIDIICKFDADLIFPENYFTELAECFSHNSRVGICGGICVTRKNDSWKLDNIASYHVRGALKAVRYQCFEDIGGFKAVLGWDGLDEMSAMFHGWQVEVLDVQVKHLRENYSDHNFLKKSFNSGYANYRNGGGFFLMLVRSIARLKRKPVFIYGILYFFGYLSAMIKNEPKTVSKELAVFINKFHSKRLFKSLF